ncbi:MAG TPA: polyribonucleotide nucleotidyltransferase [Actinomycetota bacterium]|nr:polyribonucleotide nucleotidyltransferase [Actinomycetota bacterium]
MATSIHPYTLEREIGGKTLRFEAGRLAGLADGAVLVTLGETQVLVTAVASSEPKEQFDFFPLTVDIEERMYAAGKIPGGFFRREGRAPETAILTARLCDRPLRPSFPKGFRNEVQVISTITSVDHVNPYDVISITGASMAVVLGGLPFEGPLGGLRLGFRNGEWIAFPTYQEIQDCTFDLVVAGGVNPDGDVRIIMVEAEATEQAWSLIQSGQQAPTEEIVAEGLEAAKDYIRQLCEMQNEFAALAAKPVREFKTFPEYSDEVFEAVSQMVQPDLESALTIADKAEREGRLDEIKATMKEKLGSDERFADRDKEFSPALRALTKKLVRKRIVKEGIRIDGRKLDELRPLSADVNLLPRSHGTGLFQRGETQVLSIATLGMMRMTQMIDTLDPTEEKRYMHHYNFPPFSTGEARPLRGPKRRDIGHGALAERALLPVVPSEEEFPYAIRIVSEVLSSNGSTSMASVCGSTLALMDAGVPIFDLVGGIAMGLIYEDGEYRTLTDILGAEDAFGDMDFKVAGTKDFVTALQLDTKLTGVPSDVLRKALGQAKTARMQILDVMKSALPEPRTEVSALAPRIITVQIPVDKIGEVIGPKGKKINEIQAETGAEIDIQDDGRIFIASKGGDGAEQARAMIEMIANPVMPEPGLRFDGKIVGVREGLGLFVAVPGSAKDGLVHISKLGFGQRIEKIEGAYNTGDTIQVEVQKVDEALGKISLSPINPENGERYDGPERKPREGGDRGDRGGRDRGDRGDRPRRDRGPRPEASAEPGASE